MTPTNISAIDQDSENFSENSNHSSHSNRSYHSDPSDHSKYSSNYSDDSSSDSSEDDIFSYTNAAPLNHDFSTPMEIEQASDIQDKDEKSEELIDLQVELYKNRNLKKRKRQSFSNSYAEGSKKRKELDYRTIITDAEKKREEIRALLKIGINSKNNDGIESENKSSALHRQLQEVDDELSEILRIAQSELPLNTPSKSVVINLIHEDSSVIEKAREALRKADLNEAYANKRLKVIEEEANRMFIEEKMKREAQEKSKGMEFQNKDRDTINSSQSKGKLPLSDIDPEYLSTLGEPITLSIRAGPGETFNVKIGNQATSEQLLNLICYLKNWNPQLCQLTFDGDKLNGKEFLSEDLDLEDECLLDIKVPPDARNYQHINDEEDLVSEGEKFKITVQYQKDKSFEISVRESYTTSDLVRLIQKEHNDITQGKSIALYFDGCRLEADDTIETLGLEEDDSIELRRI